MATAEQLAIRVISKAQRPTSGARWLRIYTSTVAVADALVIGGALLIAHAIRFSGIFNSPVVDGRPVLTHLTVTAVLFVAWNIALVIARTRHPRVIGSGSAEFQAIFRASWQVFAALAICAYLLKAEVGRGLLLVAFPLGTGLLLLERYIARALLKRQRRRGRCMHRVLAVGTRDKVAELIAELKGSTAAGYAVVGVCLLDGSTKVGRKVAGVKVLCSLDDLSAVAEQHSIHVVAVTGADAVTTDVVRRLGWSLEGTGIDMVLVPALVDIAGPRVVMTPVNGTQLIHVDEPRFTGGRYVLKNVIDRLGALVFVVLLSPALLVIGILVKVTSRGPVFYRQERIGLNGEPFRMFKFRSMDPDADKRLDEVMAEAGMGEVGLFYKLKDDPRVTPVGKILRRYSLDELPQLFNVIKGDMSLVGPRPQIAREVALYDDLASRRLRVRPGLTGLWQVSGRSELSPEESIRMDVFYVENWTVLGDVRILLKTARAMVGAEGAY